MNIHYFNITYTCNSSCVFCYSHNTVHSGTVHNELDVAEFVSYLEKCGITDSDRIIVNGGEPFLHSQIMELLRVSMKFGCEVLVYTNGRNLKDFDLSFMDRRFRFVIPFHGYEELHDSITRREGSFREMKQSLSFMTRQDVQVDIKVILNSWMTESLAAFTKSLDALDGLEFNGAVHITKMADTIISHKNNCPSVTNEKASYFTSLLFEHLLKKGRKMKIFDTCVSGVDVIDYTDKDIDIKVYFKDFKSEWQFPLATPEMECRKLCPKAQYCASAVGDYLVLGYDNGFYKGIE